MKRCAVILLFFLTGCAGLLGGGLPPPKAGLVGVINPNIGSYANCDLFAGNWPENELLTTDEQGNPKVAVPVVASFRVKSAITTYEHYVQFLQLPCPASYTMYVIWTNFLGEMLDRSIIHFQTSGDPFNDEYTDQYGQKAYADKFIRLPRASVGGLTQLKIHTTIPVAEFLATLMGIR